jgi:multiple sugar transport system substrate-binding protein
MRRAWAAAAVALALAAAACEGGGGGTPAGGGDGGPTEVVFWHGNTDQAARVLNELVDEFNSQNSGVRVKAEFYGNADRALQKVETAVASGVYPDIAYLYGSWAPNIAESPKVLDLSRFVESDAGFDWEDFWPAERLVSEVEGKIVGVPAVVDNLAIVYNKKLFDDAGLEHPQPDWTWADFRAAARALTDPSRKQFGTAYPADATEDTVWRWEAMLWEAGGDILTPDMSEAAFDSDAGYQALEMLRLMAVEDESIFIDTTNTKIEDLFNSGHIGMLVTGPWNLPSFPNVDYGVEIMPAFDDPTNHQTISGPDLWVLFDNGSERSQAAVDFIKWYTSGKQDLRNAMISATLPIRRSELKDPLYDKLLSKYPGIGTFVKNMGNAVKARPATPKYPLASEALGQAIVSVLLGRSGTREALEQAADKVNSILQTPS